MYNDYKRARNGAWKTLCDCGINHLPVDLHKIAAHYSISIVLYSQARALPSEVDKLSGDGFTIATPKGKAIYLNDQRGTRSRRRFTVGHELGHALLDHPLDRIQMRNNERDQGQNPLEVQANIFSRDLLMPACVLAALDIHTPEEIMRLCDVSYTSACIRAERMELLYR